MNFSKKRNVPFPLHEILLQNADDKALLQISKEMSIGLSLEEMKRVQSYFKEKGREPTDIELQSIGQAWSEHCCYKSSKNILKEFVLNIQSDKVISRGDAGVVEFDKEHAYALRIESHNHPSAIEPYGGAATGIGGIVRDVLCMGAQPIALVDPLFFGTLNYPSEKVPSGIKHPRYLFSGVVSAIRDYGNRIGVPTVSGCVYFDDRYVGNCLVNVGCVGFAKKKNIMKNAVKNKTDILILVGGKTGRDGIHGVTFASAEIDEKTEQESRGAVQLGDPITKEPLIHACLETVEKGLVNGMKDLGGGGLSCVVGEIALAGGFGAEVQLDKVPLKEEGLAPWEIWVSESQERMMLAVSPENVDKVLHIFKLWDVLATPVAKVISDKIVRIFYKGIKAFEMDLSFLTEGPVYCRPMAKKQPKKDAENIPKTPSDYNKILSSLLSSPNIASKEWVIRQYDHEVKGATVIKPLNGPIGFSTHGDASVIKPAEETYRGLAIAVGINPEFTSIDPFRGGASIMDEVSRNLASVGARIDSITNCLNFGNPEKPERLWEFHETVRGLAHISSALNVPIPSGNVSFYNETKEGAIPPTAVVLGVGIIEDVRKSITTDLKNIGNPIYLVGETKEQMGGSQYYKLVGGYSSNVPDVDVEILKNSINSLLSAIDRGCIASCHDVSDGGIAACISEMCIGGNMGASLDISNARSNIRDDSFLFSESNTRWLVEVKKDAEKEFESIVKGCSVYRLGEVCGNKLTIKNKNNVLIDMLVEQIRDMWIKPIYKLMG